MSFESLPTQTSLSYGAGLLQGVPSKTGMVIRCHQCSGITWIYIPEGRGICYTYVKRSEEGEVCFL